MDKETEMSQVDAVSSYDRHSSVKEESGHFEDGAPKRPTFAQKLKKHLRRWWWLHAILFIAITLLVVLLLSVISSGHSRVHGPGAYCYIHLRETKTNVLSVSMSLSPKSLKMASMTLLSSSPPLSSPPPQRRLSTCTKSAAA